MTTEVTPPAAGFRTTLTMHVRPDLALAFEAQWREIAGGIARHPGFCDQWLVRRSTGGPDDDVYVVVSDWVDEEQFRAFEYSAEHRENRRRLDVYREDATMTTATIVARIGPVGRR